LLTFFFLLKEENKKSDFFKQTNIYHFTEQTSDECLIFFISGSIRHTKV